MARGRVLRLFIGNMASGKTRHLLTEIDTLRKYGNKKIAVRAMHDVRYADRPPLSPEQLERRHSAMKALIKGLLAKKEEA